MALRNITLRTDFDRSISSNFRNALVEASAAGWWRDVLDDPKLVIALRGQYLNVYWQGQSIFKVWRSGTGLAASTHEKFLLDPGLKKQVPFDGSEFAVDALAQKGFLKRYEDGSLARLKRAAGMYSGEEKAGCHSVAVGNPSVIDVEVAISGSVEDVEAETTVDNPRIDLLQLREDGEGQAKLVFWEAKAFKNVELGSARSTLDAPVLTQVEMYRAVLKEVRSQVETSYARVCADLHAIRAAAGIPVHQLVEDVALGKRRVTLGDEPEVNLLVFGFDQAQKDHGDWQAHYTALSKSLQRFGGRLKAVGDPKNVKL